MPRCPPSCGLAIRTAVRLLRFDDRLSVERVLLRLLGWYASSPRCLASCGLAIRTAVRLLRLDDRLSAINGLTVTPATCASMISFLGARSPNVYDRHLGFVGRECWTDASSSIDKMRMPRVASYVMRDCECYNMRLCAENARRRFSDKYPTAHGSVGHVLYICLQRYLNMFFIAIYIIYIFHWIF